MNSTFNQAPIDTAVRGDSSGYRVAVMFDLEGVPLFEPITSGLASILTSALFYAALDSYLKSERVIAGEVGWHGNLLDGVAMFLTHNREEALQAVETLLQTSALFEFARVAWFDEAACAWRIVHRGLSPRTCEDILSPERAEARDRKTSESITELKNAIDAFFRDARLAHNPPQDPDGTGAHQ